jgi:hypothetical protein
MAQTPLLASPSFYFSFLLYHAATSGEFLSLSLSLSVLPSYGRGTGDGVCRREKREIGGDEREF